MPVSRKMGLIPGVFWFGWLLLAACSGANSPATSLNQPKLAPEAVLPDYVRLNAPPAVKEAYRFAIANPDVLKSIPCYCGCGAVGHQSNLDCYVKDMRPDGSRIVFDNHAYG